MEAPLYTVCSIEQKNRRERRVRRSVRIDFGPSARETSDLRVDFAITRWEMREGSCKISHIWFARVNSYTVSRRVICLYFCRPFSEKAVILHKSHIVISMHPSFSVTAFYKYDRTEKEIYLDSKKWVNRLFVNTTSTCRSAIYYCMYLKLYIIRITYINIFSYRETLIELVLLSFIGRLDIYGLREIYRRDLRMCHHQSILLFNVFPFLDASLALLFGKY